MRPFGLTRALLAALALGVSPEALPADTLACTAPALAEPDARHDGALLSAELVPVPGGFRTRFARVLALIEQSPDALLAGTCHWRISYLSDGLRVNGYLAMPRAGGPHPVLIANRGGNREFGAWSDHRALLSLGPIALRGYVVVASQYRGNAGGEGQDAFGGDDVNDVLNLLPLVDALPRADGRRIGMLGWRRGGMMAYLALARTDRLRALVAIGAMSDAFESVRSRPEMATGVYAELVPDWSTEPEAALHARSASRWPERLHRGTPVLILHGNADWRVSPGQALDMAAALQSVGHPYRLVMFEGGDHAINEHRGEVHQQTMDWLDRHVRDRAEPPDMAPHGR